MTAPPTTWAQPFEQPYPWLPTSICTGYGIACPRSTCNAAPGTPGEWDVNGRYTPKVG